MLDIVKYFILFMHLHDATKAVLKFYANAPTERLQFAIADVVPFVVEWTVFHEFNPFPMLDGVAFDQPD